MFGRIRLTIALAVVSVLSVYAQQQPMGGWRTHQSYNYTVSCEQTPMKVYGISEGGALFSLNKSDERLETYSKIYGLTDNQVTRIKYSQANNLLIIAYRNANIDFLTDDGEIINIPDIYSNNSITADKSINDICTDGDIAYLGCGFGIVALNIRRQEIKDSYIIGENGTYVEIRNVKTRDGAIYAMSGDRIYTAPLSGVNLLNYQNWNSIMSPTGKENRDMAVLNGRIHLTTTDNTLYSYDLATQQWKEEKKNISYVNDDNGILWSINTEGYINFTLNGQDRQVHAFSPYNTMYDRENNAVWFSDLRGIGRYSLSNSYEFFTPAGPIVDYAWEMKYLDGRIYVVPGGRWDVQYNRKGNVMIYENNTWTNILFDDIKQAVGSDALDFIDITPDPKDKTHFFVASWGLGMFEFKDDKPYRVYNATNSGVETIFPNGTGASFSHYHRMDGLTYDSDGNLWFTNSKVQRPVKYLTPSGEIKGMTYPDLLNLETIQDIHIDKNDRNRKFIIVPRSTSTDNTSLLAINDNGTPDYVNDDRTRYFTQFIYQDDNQNKAFKPKSLRCIVQDKDDIIWIGTSSGPIRIDNGDRVFNDDFAVTRIKIPRNDGTYLADYLLETEIINSIAVDGANRKWFATESSGVFLMSPDGETTIHHFTTDNSPLLSNTVYCIAINDQTGEVFFGTGNGIISYQSDAIDGEAQFSNVHAFPNPVREDYNGLITITGLMTDTRIRITDVNGNVVYETNSNGGVATWDGTRNGTERVATGVYMALCISKDGKKYAHTKILVIN